MLFERIEDKGLAQYSYLIACERAGEAAVVDPRRDVDVYLDLAKARGVRIVHVLETHIHADFASGARELAQATGATLSASAYDRGETYETQFPHRALTDGEAIVMGRVRLQALHTPGHTPEHLSYLVFDGARSETTPMILLSGDFLFVGSLGRPDLLGEAASRALAARLFASVRRVLAGLPDGLEIAPGHGAGSMCGAGMSARASSTLGFERIANPYLRADLTEAEFVELILSRVPPFPDYYRRMKALNAHGPRLLNGLPGLTPVSVARARKLIAGADTDGSPSGVGLTPHIVIDTRDQIAFGRGHIPGAYGIGASGNVSTWASWVVPYDTPLLLIAPTPEDAEAVARALVRVGLDDIRGVIDGGMDAWRRAGYPESSLPQIAPAALADRLRPRARDSASGLEAASGLESASELEDASGLRVLDVRGDDEWDSGRIAGAQHIMAGELASRLDELPSDGTIAVICGTGYRSTVAASVLARAGRRDLLNVTGGMAAWRAAGLPIEHDES